MKCTYLALLYTKSREARHTTRNCSQPGIEPRSIVQVRLASPTLHTILINSNNIFFYPPGGVCSFIFLFFVQFFSPPEAIDKRNCNHGSHEGAGQR